MALFRSTLFIGRGSFLSVNQRKETPCLFGFYQGPTAHIGLWPSLDVLLINSASGVIALATLLVPLGDKLRDLRCLARYFQRRRLRAFDELTAGHFETAWKRLPRQTRTLGGTIRQLRQFLQQVHGLVPPIPRPTTHLERELARYGGYLQRVRGCAEGTILLLLAAYGLRSSEVVALTLDDIDWRAGTLRVAQRKTRRHLILPLTDEVGQVLQRYLRTGRPLGSCGATGTLYGAEMHLKRGGRRSSRTHLQKPGFCTEISLVVTLAPHRSVRFINIKETSRKST